MPQLFEEVTDLTTGAEVLARRRYGVIEVVEGRLARISLRPFPKFTLWAEARWWGAWRHRGQPGDFCRLYYNQPLSASRYLALSYMFAGREASIATCRRALAVLDEIARLKRSDAIVGDISNPRISNRLLDRWGWQPLTQRRWHRNYIRRFYGTYPAAAD